MLKSTANDERQATFKLKSWNKQLEWTVYIQKLYVISFVTSHWHQHFKLLYSLFATLVRQENCLITAFLVATPA